MAHVAQISSLKKRRASIKSMCTRVRTYVESLVGASELTSEMIASLEERKEKLANQWSEYDSIQFELESLCEGEEGDRELFEGMFFEINARMRSMISRTGSAMSATIDARSVTAEPSAAVINSMGNVRLPKLDLPKFTGKYEEWFPFYEMFNSVINENRSINDFQRLQYLRASVVGEAANIIESLELSEQNYRVAWNLLRERYDNRRAIVQTHLQALFLLPNISKENAVDLRRLADATTKHLQALKALRCPTEHWGDMLIHLISSKFDSLTAKEWQSTLSGTELPTYKQFSEFLNNRCQLLESVTKNHAANQYAGRRVAAHVATTASSCGYCRGSHLIYYCRDFLKLSIPQRHAEIRKRRLCTNCLRGNNHSSGNCKSGACKICGIKHNSLLHVTAQSNERHEKTKPSGDSSPDLNEETDVMAHSSTACNKRVLLSTAIVYLSDVNGMRQTARVLLDSGSQANFITRACIGRLHLKSNTSDIRITGINGMVSCANEIAKIKMQSRLNGFTADLDCIVTDRITEGLPAFPVNRASLHMPRNIKLADPEFYRCSEIDVLIGAELFWQLLCIGTIRSPQMQPIWQKTHFGWIVAGRVHGGARRERGREVRSFQVSVADAQLQRQLAQFWRIEEGHQSSGSWSAVERFCEQHFRRNVSREPRGRVIVALPFQEDRLKDIGDTRETALRRFYNLEKRLNRDAELKLQYKAFIHEYLSLGHMHLVDRGRECNSSLPVCYLPHHCVLKPSNETTKLRVIFDASCKSSTGVSLNDALLVGPTVQQDLFSIVARFRTFRIVFSADITKMYRQILIKPEQTQLQRIFWRDEPSMDMQTFELKTVTYGTASASYLATRTLQFLAETYEKEFSRGSQRIIRDFYVDDLLTGADNIEDALQIKKEIVEILRQGGFQLSKWSSNDPRLLNDSRSERNNAIHIDGEVASRILGIIWQPVSDAFRFEIKLPEGDSAHAITRRSMLSEVARLFDPLGLIGPVIIVPKMMIQEIWQLKMHWDESIPTDLHTRWSEFKAQLSILNEVNIPRFVGGFSGQSNSQIHGFCDASQRAYGACLYVRREIRKGEFCVELLCSKTRVAPLKTTSIPRLELCAAVLLAQLWDKVRASIGRPTGSLYLWSDSTIALRWISSCSRKWAVFVANRIGEIQRLTSISDWRHISSNENPADLLSRGSCPQNMLNSALWWHGLAFLRDSEDSWPESDACVPESEMPEMRRVVAAVTRATISPFIEIIQRFSNLDKICRVIAYCLRFLKPRLHPQRGTDIHVSREEISVALETLAGFVQREAFSAEVKQLKRGGTIESSSPLLSLSPFIDEQGIMRVGGRLRNAQVSCGARHPILLPKNHKLTRLIIEQEHVRNLHAGIQGTIAAVRQNFWPLSIRSTTRKAIRLCGACFRCKPIASEAKMGDLPRPRVVPSRPFSSCGVDYAGPLLIREGKRRNAKNVKAYVSVFICLATKAVHLELVSDLTTDAFLAALKRFMSRRGKPAAIYSDNGTNFKGASRQLTELHEFCRAEESRDKIKRFCCRSQTSWHFIPPGAPHFGGLWEAAVKSAKYYLQRVVGDSHLTFEELQTVLCEIEAILNSRPLTPLSSDPNDLVCLTPGHFSIGDALNGLPCRDLSDVQTNRLVRWQRVDQMRQHFWQRWSREYLNQLQQRQKWQANKGQQLEVGRMVLLKQPGLPPMR